jgi:hypothetical protein
MEESNNLVKEDNEIFCPECGKPIKREAIICIHCGVQVKKLSVEPKEVQRSTSKSKGVAVLLAIFFGLWAWLYIYGRAKLQFWITIAVVGMLFINLFLFAPLNILYDWFFLIFMPFHLWALIDISRRQGSFYENYPNG